MMTRIRTRQISKRCQVVFGSIAFCLLAVSANANDLSQDFARSENYQINSYRGAPLPIRHNLAELSPIGKPALELTIQSPHDNSGTYLSWKFPAEILDGKTFYCLLRNAGPDLINYLWVEFHSSTGQVWSARYFNVSVSGWQKLSFTVGKQGQASHADKEFVSGQPITEIRLGFGGAAKSRFVVHLSQFGQQHDFPDLRVRRPTATPTIISGNTRLWLDSEHGYRFAGAQLTDRFIEPRALTPFPLFRFRHVDGRQLEFACDANEVRAEAELYNDTFVVVHYHFPGARIRVTWSLTPETITCNVVIVDESDLRCESVGRDRFLTVALEADDYGITPDGYLIRPAPQEEVAFDLPALSNQARLNMAAARVGDHILFLKPLTYANKLCGAAIREHDADLLELGTSLYFRPIGFLDPKTIRVHDELGWRLEMVRDTNGDGEVDWVDAGIAYRDRWVTTNPKKDSTLRESYRLFHQTPSEDTWQKLIAASSRLDFASGMYYVKGAIKTILTDQRGQKFSHPSELHPYRVERSSMGDKNSYLDQIKASGNRFGIYYGGEYFHLASGDWPQEFIKRDREGKPMVAHRYYAQLLNFDRAHRADLLIPYWASVMDTARVAAGDPVYLDGYNSRCDFSYDPRYPTTPQSELAARRDLSRWFRDTRNILVAGEGLIEGVTDLDQFALNQFGFYTHANRLWTSGFPEKFVPLHTVVYTGKAYCGEGWYEVRNGSPNWATWMTFCAGMWDWDSIYYPDYLYPKVARQFFNNNIFWAQIADHLIADFDQDGDEYMIRFHAGANGSAPTVWTNPRAGRFWLETGGIRYDGFTPFSSRGVMAILKQGDFDLTLPFRHELEILPSQPHRESIRIDISRTPQGFVRVRGNFSERGWQLPKLTGDSNTAVDEKITLVDVEPVLLLRRKR